MFFQEAPKLEGFSETTKFLFGIAALVVSNLFTFLATRQRSDSEARKNDADAHKSEADTMRTNVATIAALTGELDEVIIRVKELRIEVQELQDVKDNLSSALAKAERLERDRVDELQQSFDDERRGLRETLVAITTKFQHTVDLMIADGVSQTLRMEIVKILEGLYNLINSLKKKKD